LGSFVAVSIALDPCQLSKLPYSVTLQASDGLPELPDQLGVSSEHLKQMEDRQPGSDGGKLTHRVQRAAYKFDGEPGGLLQQQLRDLLIQLFRVKGAHNGSAELITDVLGVLAATPLVDDHARANMPLSFKAMLAALHQFGFPRADMYEYDMCPCGELYR